MNSFFFVPNSRKMYGWEMPTFSAIASTDVPYSPNRANSAIAAVRISSLRSSALDLAVRYPFHLPYC